MKKYVDQYIELFARPKKFFTSAAKEKSYQNIILFVAGFVLLGEILQALVWMKQLPVQGGELFSLVIISPIATIIMTFIAAGIAHLLISYYKKKEYKDFFSTWKVVGYAAVIPVVYEILTTLITFVASFLNPSENLLAAEQAWTPFTITMAVILGAISLISLAHVLYTETLGFEKYHKLTRVQAFTAALAPVIGGLVIALLIGAAVSFLL